MSEIDKIESVWKTYEEIKSNYDKRNSTPSRTHTEMSQYSDREPTKRWKQ